MMDKNKISNLLKKQTNEVFNNKLYIIDKCVIVYDNHDLLCVFSLEDENEYYTREYGNTEINKFRSMFNLSPVKHPISLLNI